MNRRGFLGATLASAAGACGMPLKESAVAPPRVALADVRRLVVERADPIAGRCRYVADLGAREVPQPILFARRGKRNGCGTCQIGRAHGWNPGTATSRMPAFALKKKKVAPRSEEHTSELQ